MFSGAAAEPPLEGRWLVGPEGRKANFIAIAYLSPLSQLC